MNFHSPEFFILFPIIFVICVYIFLSGRRRKGALLYSSLSNLPKMPVSFRSLFRVLPFILKILAIIFVVIALARPQQMNEKSSRSVKGIDIMIVLDVSLSMLIEDMGNRKTRLSVAKKVVSNFIKGRLSDRIGLIIFSGESYTRVPLTLDYNLLLENLISVQTDQSLKLGTAIGVALANAVVRLKHSDLKNKIIIFVTDGENNAGSIDPLTALEIVREENIKVYPVGLGKEGKQHLVTHVVEDPFGNKQLQRSHIESMINKDLMKKIADETNGKFFMASDERHLSKIFDQINDLEKQDIKTDTWVEYDEKFIEFLIIAILFYLSSFLLRHTIFFKGI